MKTFQLQVLAPENPYYEGPCQSLVITTTEGQYGVLADHSNAILAVMPGTIKLTIPGEEERFAAISHGLLKIENNQVLVLANTIEEPEDIDENRAQHDLEEAQEALLRQQSRRDYIQAQMKMARAMNRLRVKHHGEHL